MRALFFGLGCGWALTLGGCYLRGSCSDGDVEDAPLESGTYTGTLGYAGLLTDLGIDASAPVSGVTDLETGLFVLRWSDGEGVEHELTFELGELLEYESNYG